MRISDWSSDVCSSDLGIVRRAAEGVAGEAVGAPALGEVHRHAGIRRFDPVGSRQAVAAQLDVAGDQRVLRAEGGELGQGPFAGDRHRSEEHTSELQSLMRISYAVFCLKKQKTTIKTNTPT